jgi:hypothetical protein
MLGQHKENHTMSRAPIAFSHRDIALRILRYLDEHPDARDTVNGVIERWIIEQCIREEKGKVLETLREMVAQGVLLEHRRKNAEEQFSINREKRDQIRDLLT